VRAQDLVTLSHIEQKSSWTTAYSVIHERALTDERGVKDDFSFEDEPDSGKRYRLPFIFDVTFNSPVKGKTKWQTKKQS